MYSINLTEYNLSLKLTCKGKDRSVKNRMYNVSELIAVEVIVGLMVCMVLKPLFIQLYTYKLI